MSDNPKRYIPTKSDFVDSKAAFNELDKEVDLQTLVKSSLSILNREIKALVFESSKGKLSKGSATDLVSYIKLLNELHDKEQELLENLSEDDLKDILNGKTRSISGRKGTEEAE